MFLNALVVEPSVSDGDGIEADADERAVAQLPRLRQRVELDLSDVEVGVLEGIGVDRNHHDPPVQLTSKI